MASRKRSGSSGSRLTLSLPYKKRKDSIAVNESGDQTDNNSSILAEFTKPSDEGEALVNKEDVQSINKHSNKVDDFQSAVSSERKNLETEEGNHASKDSSETNDNVILEANVTKTECNDTKVFTKLDDDEEGSNKKVELDFERSNENVNENINTVEISTKGDESKYSSTIISSEAKEQIETSVSLQLDDKESGISAVSSEDKLKKSNDKIPSDEREIPQESNKNNSNSNEDSIIGSSEAKINKSLKSPQNDTNDTADNIDNDVLIDKEIPEDAMVPSKSDSTNELVGEVDKSFAQMPGNEIENATIPEEEALKRMDTSQTNDEASSNTGNNCTSRRRAASDEQQQPKASINNSVRFGKKRSYSEVSAPPKFKGLFTRKLAMEHNKTSTNSNHSHLLRNDNDGNDSDTTISIASITKSLRPRFGTDSTIHFSANDSWQSFETFKQQSEEDLHSAAASVSSKVEVKATNGSNRNNIAERRLPSKKRKESHDISVLAQKEQLRKESWDLSVSFENDLQNQQWQRRKGSDEVHKKPRKGSYDLSVSFEDTVRLRADSTASMLVDVMLSPRKYSSDANSSANLTALGEPPEYKIDDNTQKRSESEKEDNDSLHYTSQLDMSALDDLDDDHKPKATIFPAKLLASSHNDDHSVSDDTFASSGHRLLIEAIMLTTGSGASITETEKAGLAAAATAAEKHPNHAEADNAASSISTRRERLESWGGMSALSLPYGSDSALMMNLLGTWQQPDSGNTLESPSIEQVLFVDEKPGAIPSRILMGGRSRLNSLASLSETSSCGVLPPLATHTNPDEAVDVEGNIHDFVAAAMASVGDQIAELASAVENAAELGFDFDEENSNATPMILGAFADAVSTSKTGSRPRSWSTSSGMISVSVDYDAVQAAVYAAEAASGSLGLTSSSKKEKEKEKKAPVNKKLPKANPVRRKLPTKKNRAADASISSTPSSDPKENAPKPKSKKGQKAEAETEPSLPPIITSSTSTPAAAQIKPARAPKKERKKSTPAIKKRSKKDSASPVAPVSSSNVELEVTETPKICNKKSSVCVDEDTDEGTPTASSSKTKSARQQSKQAGQSNQKWESMFECLVEFANERRAEETASLSEQEKEVWVWDGNVPTNYKSKDGKALGRWVNNQRSAKGKGNLKEDREQRLIDVGLKWSVMASNSWNLMLNELTIYINDQAKKGIKWDGNVPTNYQIKTKLDSEFAGEDKNLGRWVNRQRSMYQAGKLRKDRQLELEKIGLKWSMLATTSWDSMYESLLEYVNQQTKESGSWDGNVPANYKTDDNPPRSLGRWINRQRSAFIKQKLKQEYIDKLNKIGLKWSIHHRHGEIDGDDGYNSDSDREGDDANENDDKPESLTDSVPSLSNSDSKVKSTTVMTETVATDITDPDKIASSEAAESQPLPTPEGKSIPSENEELDNSNIVEKEDEEINQAPTIIVKKEDEEINPTPAK